MLNFLSGFEGVRLYSDEYHIFLANLIFKNSYSSFKSNDMIAVVAENLPAHISINNKISK